MARLKGPIKFTGRLGGLHSYYNKSIKSYVVVTNGGASKELIMNNPTFARTRENMNEFKACGMWASLLRKALASISHLYSGYYFSDIMSLSKKIQNMDDVNPKGFRAIESHRYPHGFFSIKFNRERPLERICSLRPVITLSDDKKRVTLKVEGLRPYSNIHWPNRYMSFRFSLVALQLADLVWNATDQKYAPSVKDLELLTATTLSDWMPGGVETIDFTLEASFAEPALQQPGTVVLVALGLEVSPLTYNENSSALPAQGTMGIVECFM